MCAPFGKLLIQHAPFASLRLLPSANQFMLARSLAAATGTCKAASLLYPFASNYHYFLRPISRTQHSTLNGDKGLLLPSTSNLIDAEWIRNLNSPSRRRRRSPNGENETTKPFKRYLFRSEKLQKHISPYRWFWRGKPIFKHFYRWRTHTMGESLMENIYTIPNALSLMRICASPYIGYLILHSNFNWAFALIIVAGLTDMVDGFIARKWKGQSSKFGSFLDPLADKVIISTLFVSLTYVDMMPLALTSLVVVRDVCLALGASYIRLQSIPSPKSFKNFFDFRQATAQLRPTFVSKVNTLFQLVTAVASVSAPVFGFEGNPVLYMAWCITGGLTISSGLSYVFTKTALYKPK